MTNSYKEIFRLASPNANTLIRIVDEPTVGRIGAKELVATVLAEAGESFDEYTIFTSVDSGSTTTDIGTSEQCELDGAVIDKFLAGKSLRYGSNMINAVIHRSDLSAPDKLTLEERLESRKGNLQGHQAVQVGMENVARDHRLALTEPPGYDIFFDNHKGSVKKPNSRPLQIWSRDSTFKHYFMMDTNSKPLVLELKARSGTKTVSKGLELSITLYVPRIASLEIKTSQSTNDPAPLARSTKGLKHTGKLEVTLPIESSFGTVYMVSAIIARTAVFGLIFNKEGTYVPELEGYTITARDIFENGIFSGRLRQEYTEMGLLYMEVESALLPELERYEIEKQGPRGTKHPRDESEIIVLSSDDDEQGCPVRGFDQGYQKLPSAKTSTGEQLRCHTEPPPMNTAPIGLHPTKKRAVSMLGSSAALVGRFVAESFRAKGEHAKLRDSDSSATPISNSERIQYARRQSCSSSTACANDVC
ncbi:hypothetical protein MBLNU13_g10837t2 [Cladosporium sp. NU13]